MNERGQQTGNQWNSLTALDLYKSDPRQRPKRIENLHSDSTQIECDKDLSYLH
jgi:hypothetical protein